jgi:hypothetical protein
MDEIIKCSNQYIIVLEENLLKIFHTHSLKSIIERMDRNIHLHKIKSHTSKNNKISKVKIQIINWEKYLQFIQKP